jgi:serine/threonine-protein kinase RsbW
MVSANKTLLYKMSFPSDRNFRQKVVEAVIHEVFSGKLNPQIEKEELYLIIDEAVTNAMEHGNHWDPSKHVVVEIITNTTSIAIHITDQGKGFDTLRVKDAMKRRNVLSTRGRGIYIISQFSDPTWNESGNQIKLKIRRGRN